MVAAATMDIISQPIPKYFPQFLRQYVGNPRLFKFFAPLEKWRFVAYWNNAYMAAPSSKWLLSGIPLYGVLRGDPPVDKLDINTSFALACTGFVWMCYAMMITPQNRGSQLLALVNFCLLGVNGYNVARRVRYEYQLKQKTTEAKALPPAAPK